MIVANDIKTLIDSLFPFFMAQEWDNVGIIVGRGEKSVKTIMITLDVDENVVGEAVNLGCDMILSHHPLMFHPIKKLCDTTAQQRTIRALVSNDITLLSAHTNLDCAFGGLNDYLADKLGIMETEIVDVVGYHNEKPYGFGRIGFLESPISLGEYLKIISDKLGTEGIRYCGSLDKKINKVAINCGSGADALSRCIELGADAFVTGDVKYNPFREAYESNMAVIDAGHYETENIVLELFEQVLNKKFPEIQIFKSKTNIPTIKYYV